MRDTFGRQITYLRLSVTDMCDLRCRYCMPADGVEKKSHRDMLTEDEMVMAAEAAVAVGVEKIRITGGEPLVKKNILSICRRIGAIPGVRELCLTTNGILLPQFAKPLLDAGVSRLNISLDTLDPDKYAYITRVGKLEDAIAGIEAALDAGFQKVKINAVLIGGFNDREIPRLATLTRRYPVDMRFIELMPMYDGGDFGAEAYVPYSRVLEQLPEMEPVPGEKGSVAQLYRLPDSLGNIGLISPVSAHFCGECNRVRLTADGKIKPCLHAALEYPIKGLELDGMIAQFRRAVREKPEWHGELSPEHRSRANRNMNQIGG